MQIEDIVSKFITNPEQVVSTIKNPDSVGTRAFVKDMKRLAAPNVAHFCYTLGREDAVLMAAQRTWRSIEKLNMHVLDVTAEQCSLLALNTFYCDFATLGVPGLSIWVKYKNVEGNNVLLVSALEKEDNPKCVDFMVYRFGVDNQCFITASSCRVLTEDVASVRAFPKVLSRAHLLADSLTRNPEGWDPANTTSIEVSLATELINSNVFPQKTKLDDAIKACSKRPLIFRENGQRYDPKSFAAKSYKSAEAILSSKVAPLVGQNDWSRNTCDLHNDKPFLVHPLEQRRLH